MSGGSTTMRLSVPGGPGRNRVALAEERHLGDLFAPFGPRKDVGRGIPVARGAAQRARVGFGRRWRRARLRGGGVGCTSAAETGRMRSAMPRYAALSPAERRSTTIRRPERTPSTLSHLMAPGRRGGGRSRRPRGSRCVCPAAIAVNDCRTPLAGHTTSSRSTLAAGPSPMRCRYGDAPNEPPLVTTRWRSASVPSGCRTNAVIRAPMAARLLVLPTRRTPSERFAVPGFLKSAFQYASPGTNPPMLASRSSSPSPSTSPNATPWPFCRWPGAAGRGDVDGTAGRRRCGASRSGTSAA